MTTTTTEYRKEIKYDRLTRDYAMYLDGELVGYARTHHDAEVELDELVFDLLLKPTHYCSEPTDENDSTITDLGTWPLPTYDSLPDEAPFPGDNCKNCHGTHYTYACPEIEALLMRPEWPQLLA